MAIFIPDDKISEIKNSADIVDIVSESVLLKKAGRNFVGLCPFHTEKTPSFTVSPEKQIYYCFGCGAGGNIFSFLMKQDGLAFPEAARTLANRYGIDLPTKPLSPEERKKISLKESLLHINQQAMDFFRHELLRSVAGKPALSYLEQRGISRQTIDEFNLGFAPRGWDYLKQFFSKKRISLELLEKAGLIVARKDNSGFYDRFRERIIFPIIDVNSRVVGFGGRVMDDSEPKYLNSPETDVYNKSRTLYGLNRTRDNCRKEKSVYIVEGYLDLLALYQNGIHNCVATLGTALTAAHIRLLKRYAQRMILVYDSDEAGIRSAQRCVGTFWKEHVNFQREDVFREERADTRILVLADGHDPDSYLQEFGPQAFVEAASRAPGVISFLISCAIDKHGLSTEGKIRIVSELAKPLSAINDSVARSLYVQQLAEKIGIDETVILEKMRKLAQTDSKNDYGRRPGELSKGNDIAAGSLGFTGRNMPGQRVSRLEQQIITMMMQFPEILPEINKHKILEYFESEKLHSIGFKIIELKLNSVEQISELLSSIEDAEAKRMAAELAMADESWDRKGCQKLINQFIESVQRRRNNRLMEKKIKAAEMQRDQSTLRKLLSEKQKMAIHKEKQKMASLKVK